MNRDTCAWGCGARHGKAAAAHEGLPHIGVVRFRGGAGVRVVSSASPWWASSRGYHNRLGGSTCQASWPLIRGVRGGVDHCVRRKLVNAAIDSNQFEIPAPPSRRGLAFQRGKAECTKEDMRGPDPIFLNSS